MLNIKIVVIHNKNVCIFAVLKQTNMTIVIAIIQITLLAVASAHFAKILFQIYKHFKSL